MSKQTAKTCLLYYGDGGGTPITGTTYALVNTGGVYTLTDSGSGFVTDGVTKWSQITVSGFGDTPTFVAVVTAVVAGTVTFVSPVTPDTREDVTIVAEAAGDSVSITVEKFSQLLGQDNTTYQKSASTIDVSDKNSGNWGASLAGTVTLNVTAGGKIEFTTDGAHGGWKAINDAVDNGDVVNMRLVLNARLDAYYGPFSISSQDGGGGTNDPNTYSFSLSASARPVYVPGA